MPEQQIPVEDLTPMMQQSMETNKQYKDCIVFYLLGDFYEMSPRNWSLLLPEKLVVWRSARPCAESLIMPWRVT